MPARSPRRHIFPPAVLAVLCLTPIHATAGGDGTPRVAGRGYNADFLTSVFRTAAAGTTVLGAWKFESGASCTTEGWASVDLTGSFGDYAAPVSGTTLFQQDPCTRDLSCAWAFISGSTHNYDCGSFPSQVVVPYGSSAAGYIHNEIWSPVVDLAGSGSELGLEFAVYRELDLDGLVFYTYRVRSHTGGTPGPWRGPGQLFYAPIALSHAGDWLRHRAALGAFVDPGAEAIQVALGVVDMAGVWSGLLGSGACHSHAPLFDGVRLYRVESHGPQWSVDPADLFQDAFAEDGTLTGAVRLDMARDVNPRDAATIRAGDSLVVSVGEPTVGLGYHTPGDAASGPAVYLYVRDVSDTKSGAVVSGDLARWPVVETANVWTVLRFDSVRTGDGVVPGQFCVDLNDELYRPGERVDFYFSARDALGRTTSWSEFSGTVAGMGATDSPMEMTCLPVNGLVRSSILYVDDADSFGAQPYFDVSFQALGLLDEVDRYDVRCPDGLVGNGPGSRVRDVAQQLGNYDSIIWSTSNLGHGLIGDGSGAPEKSPDAQMLVEYLARKPARGFVYLTGDNLAYELDRLSTPAVEDLKGYIGYRITDNIHRFTYGISPIGQAVAAGTFITDPSFIVYGGCPLINQFDVLEPQGTARNEITYGAGTAASVNGAVVSQNTSGRWVVLSGFGFEFMRDNDADGVMDRADHLYDILESRKLTLPCGANQATFTTRVSEVHMTWSFGVCPDLLGGRIHRRYLPGGALEPIAEIPVPPASGSFTDAEPEPGALVHYRISALMTQAREVLVDSTTVMLAAEVTDMQAVSDDVAITVSWKISDVTNLTGLTLERRPAGPGDFAPVGGDSILPPDADRFRDVTLEPGRRYDYRLRLRYGARTIAGATVQVTAPAALALAQNAPNPFNPATTIRFLLPAAGRATITIYDVRGARVRDLTNAAFPEGVSEVVWDGRDDRGSPVTSGVYFYRLSTPGGTITKRMVMVK